MLKDSESSCNFLEMLKNLDPSGIFPSAELPIFMRIKISLVAKYLGILESLFSTCQWSRQMSNAIL